MAIVIDWASAVLISVIFFNYDPLATLAIFQLVRPVLGGRMIWPAIVAAISTENSAPPASRAGISQ